ncbi:Ctr copper transporter [Cadophora sp. DSE1049]|nr:Ctr copper transporter [Cadophora sp. DSE1049]
MVFFANPIQMLLNWHTIDACFLSSIFHIRSSFTFFLACLGAFLLVISLEFLRRFQREFDRYLRKRNEFLQAKAYVLPEETEEKLLDKGTNVEQTRKKKVVVVLEQLLRGLIHVVQFSVSYCIMLLFMYSNGYIIISILVGALVGFALFTRDTLYSSQDTK